MTHRMPLKSPVKPLFLAEILKVVELLGKLTDSTLDPHSLALVITKSGEATFTRSGWKILSEAGFSSPLAKVIINCVQNYTNFCGEDCKYFLFVLKEMVQAIHNMIDGNGEAYLRAKFIKDFISLKQNLPCIFNCIRSMSCIHLTFSDSSSFCNDLKYVVKAFMDSRFSTNVSKHLSSLICDFVVGIMHKESSLKIILDYITAHFDVFCSKVLARLSESQVLKGFVFSKKECPPIATLKNTKFLIIWDLSKKILINDISWKISDESFISKLNSIHVYQKIFTCLNEQNIKLLLTPSTADKDIKLQCEKNNIILLDRLENEEVENILSCINLSPLENLNECIESNHMGHLDYFKLLSYTKSYFLNLLFSNSPKFLNTHHILLCAPFDALWKEYYSECLNCLKMIQQWLSPNSNTCLLQSHHKSKEHLNSLSQQSATKLCFNPVKTLNPLSEQSCNTHSVYDAAEGYSNSAPEQPINAVHSNFVDTKGVDLLPEQPVTVCSFNSVIEKTLNSLLKQPANICSSDSVGEESMNLSSKQSGNKTNSTKSLVEGNLNIQSQFNQSYSVNSNSVIESNVDTSQLLNDHLCSDNFKTEGNPNSLYQNPINKQTVSQNITHQNIDSNLQKCKSFDSALELHHAVLFELCDGVTKIDINQQPTYEKRNCDICSQLETSFNNSFKLYRTLDNNSVNMNLDIGFALPPGLWELSFQTSLERVSFNLNLSCKNIIKLFHFIYEKLLCMRIGVPFGKVKDLQRMHASIYEISIHDKSMLEPVVCKEIMIYSVIDLIVQLLKIDAIVSTK